MEISTLAALLDEQRYGDCRDAANELLRTCSLPDADRAQVFLALSYSLSALQSGQEAVSPAELAVYFSRQAGDYDLLGRILCHLAMLYHELGLHKRAAACLDEYFQYFALYERSRLLEGWVLSKLGLFYQAMGRAPKALEYCKRAYGWHVASESPTQLVEEQRGNLIWQHLKLGQLYQARELLSISNAYLRQVPNDLEARAGYMNNQAYRYFLTGSYGAAIDSAVQVMHMRNVAPVRKAQACLTLHHTARAMGLEREALGLGTLTRIQANVAHRPDLEDEACRSLLHTRQAQRLPLMDELLRSLQQFTATANEN
ncbi:MAG TPA: hypothetical protein VNT01_14845 [Symbiobacteriaceae bacterium]|nr:hypothetical protein [Symbiobacteriaceae bacterium]